MIIKALIFLQKKLEIILKSKWANLLDKYKVVDQTAHSIRWETRNKWIQFLTMCMFYISPWTKLFKMILINQKFLNSRGMKILDTMCTIKEEHFLWSTEIDESIRVRKMNREKFFCSLISYTKFSETILSSNVQYFVNDFFILSYIAFHPGGRVSGNIYSHSSQTIKHLLYNIN